MEGNSSQGPTYPGLTPYGGLDFQGPHPHTIQHQQQQQQQLFHIQGSDQPVSVTDFSTGERRKRSVRDENDPSFTEEDQHHANTGQWKRVKWTDEMARLLINAVSYVSEDMVVSDSIDSGTTRKFAFVQKKGKWKAISKVLSERGFNVSPQQSEDKFNDLNKRYKTLNKIIGRGTTCKVVENPAYLDVLSYLTEKDKNNVRRILSSKQLFYEQMCSFHNGNRLHLPHDPALRSSLQLALIASRHDHARRNQHDYPDEDEDEDDDEDDDDDDEEDDDDGDEYDENHDSYVDTRGLYGSSRKRKRPDQDGQEDVCFVSSFDFQDCDNGSYSHPTVAETDMIKAMEGSLSQGPMDPGLTTYGGFDLQGLMRAPQHTIQHQYQLLYSQGSSVHTSIPLTMGAPHSSDQPVSGTDFSILTMGAPHGSDQPVSVTEGERGKNSVSCEDAPSLTEEGANDQNDANRGEKGWPCKRVKWTDPMVRLLINAVSCGYEDAASASKGGFRRKFACVQKKGKWKAISNIMSERGFEVLPQQCEDKFNELNKRYKKLNEKLGRGTACLVVENPALLELISYLTEKEKDDVRRILNSKQLFYDEMCCFHSRKRLHLPYECMSLESKRKEMEAGLN